MGSFDRRQILVAVDGSEASWAALRVGLELGAALGCRVSAITAVQTRLPGYRAGYFSFVDRHVLDELRAQATGIQEEARSRAKEHSVELQTVTVEGEEEVYEQIACALERNPDVAFLVLGSYSHLRERHLLGSTTQRLILEIARRELKVPVLVVP